MFEAPGRTWIGTLRAEGSGAEEEIPSRLAFALGGVDLHPASMPPSGVLLVRRVEDPLPGGLPLGPGRPAPPRWEAAARASVEQAWRTAARPGRAPLPPDTPALYFEDEAQLWAHYFVDLAAGRAGQRWWWRRLARRHPDPTSLWASSPQLLPPTLALLARWREAAALTAAVPHPREAARLLGALIGEEEGALRWFERRRAEGPAGEGAAPAPLSPAQVAGLPADLACTVELAIRIHEHVSEIKSALGREPRGTPPALAGAKPPPPRPGAPAGQRPAAQPASPSLSPAAEVGPDPAPSPGASALPGGASITSGQRRASEGEGARAQVGAPGGRERGSPHRAASPAVRSDGGPPAAPPLEGRERGIDPAPPPWGELRTSPLEGDGPARAEPPALAGLLAQEGVHSERAGAFLLLNVLIHLDLPRVQEQSWRLASGLGPWGTLELVARAILDDGGQADPLWSTLALLAGREPGVLPDAALTLPSGPDLPPGLLGVEPLPLPLAGRWLLTLPPAARAWIQQVVPPLAGRIAQSLGAGGLPSVLAALRRSGRVFATRTHVDVVYPLQDTDVAVRRAGLDLDPGWQVEWGRVVLFHYR